MIMVAAPTIWKVDNMSISHLWLLHINAKLLIVVGVDYCLAWK